MENQSQRRNVDFGIIRSPVPVLRAPKTIN